MAETSSDGSVRIAGHGTRDDVDCERFRVDGSGSVAGRLRADEVSVNGRIDVGGAVDAGDVDVDGTATVEGDVRATHLTVDGSGSFHGNLGADSLDLDGSTTVAGNLDAQEVVGDGGTTVEGSLVAAEASFDGSVSVGDLVDAGTFNIDGNGRFGEVTVDEFTAEGALDADRVTAERFEFTVGGDSSADALAADTVVVRQGDGGHSFLRALFGSTEDPVFVVETIEGDAVDLNAVRARTVVGESVRLGPDADVEVVYTDDLDADPAATVGEQYGSDEY